MEIEVGEFIRDIYNRIGKIQRYSNGTYFTEKFGASSGEIIKHSKNIIDLIEQGDYVNGDKVVGRDNNSILTLTDSGQTCYRSIFESKDIKSIITKEQIKQIEYIIEE